MFFVLDVDAGRCVGYKALVFEGCLSSFSRSFFPQHLHELKDNYLHNARNYLTAAQFDALREQEQIQTNEIWSSLSAGWEIK
ncbi:MAG: hypothetical protein U5M23_16155 [Marinagarivorans sp.]|nr:hypothetical protein [Marinagarivorans sp.]